MSHLFLHEKAADWASGSFDHSRIASGSSDALALQTERGAFTSPSLHAPFAATEAIVSVNLRNADPSSAGMAASLSCSSDGAHWSQWYHLLVWGNLSEEAGCSDGPEGRVKIDVLKLDKPQHHWRYRVEWSDANRKAAIRRVALNVYSAAEKGPEIDTENRAAWGRRLNVPFFSQSDVKQHPANRVCSPTSLAMTAHFHRAELSADDLASAAYDRVHDVYGNWPLNMLAVSLHGLKAYVDRGARLRFLEDRIAAGVPTIVSLSFGENELSGAPVPKTDGHLVVVAGFDESGNPIARDPAARGADVWVTYDRTQFASAWLGHGGVAYIVEPES